MAESAAITRQRLVQHMRAENPDIGSEIERFCEMGAQLDEVMSGLRFPRHWCINCSYDLYGNVSGVCPECGELADLSPFERKMHSCQILGAMRNEYPSLHTVMNVEKQQRRDEQLRELGEQRRQRREKALQSYLEWSRQFKHRES